MMQTTVRVPNAGATAVVDNSGQAKQQGSSCSAGSNLVVIG